LQSFGSRIATLHNSIADFTSRIIYVFHSLREYTAIYVGIGTPTKVWLTLLRLEAILFYGIKM
jgi:hypothetical protein